MPNYVCDHMVFTLRHYLTKPYKIGEHFKNVFLAMIMRSSSGVL